jgi:thiol-disulfide isomerase/thioredoxin
MIIYIILTFIILTILYFNSESFTNNKIKIYNFNTSWCGHSIKFQPVWNAFANSIESSDNIIPIDAKCDDSKYDDLIKKYNVDGFPTIIIDYGNKYIKYSGPRSVNNIRKALNLTNIDKYDEIKQDNNIQIVCNNKKNIVNNKTKIYNFNTEWCGYSVRFQPIWNKFSSMVIDPNIEIIDVKCDNPDNDELCKKYNIPGFPSIVKVINDNYIIYDGPRTIDGLINFIR